VSGSEPPGPAFRRQWRFYRTPTGASPVRHFLAALEPEDANAVRAAMRAVAIEGRVGARHLRGDIYEVRAARSGRAWRLLFSAEGRFHHVLLALSAFEKRTPKAPRAEIELAESRLHDWRRRGH